MKVPAPLLLLFALLPAACAGGGRSGGISTPGRGAIAIAVVPNPIVAARVAGDTYDFPFEVVVRETGGRPVGITRVTADVYALGGIRVASETYDAAKIRSLGYATAVPAAGELRYRFNPRRAVPDERLFGGVFAELRVDAVDDLGTPASATATVTVRR
ncbi:MAG TPA: hypothetical protein VNL91_04280 [Thermoanaerobaculia bacterium]|nr:hypothetical protein [Thermoanaerobaculia bacterium]